MTDLHLCTYSKSETHAHAILPSCPLSLSSTCASKCLCKTRKYLRDKLRVMVCTYPLTWKGEAILDEGKLADKIRELAGQKPKKGKRAKGAGDVSSGELDTAGSFDDVELDSMETELEEDMSSELVVSDEQKVVAGRMEHLVNQSGNPKETIREMGKWMADSGMFGLGPGKVGEAQGSMLAMTAYATGTNVIKLAAEYHIMPTGLAMKSKIKLAKFRGIGGKHKILRRDSECASVELTLDGETQTFTFTHEDAQKEPFYKKKDGHVHENYATPRKRMQMLWNRVIGDGVDTLAPEIAGGLYTPEDLMDVQAEKERGPVQTPKVEVIQTSTPPAPAPEPEEIEVEATVTPTPAPVIEVQPEPEPPAPAEAATEEQPAQAEDAEPPFEADSPMTPAQLVDLKKMCTELNKLDKTAWQTKVLDVLGFASAKGLTQDEADQVFCQGTMVLNALKGKTELEKWANDAVAKN